MKNSQLGISKGNNEQEDEVQEDRMEERVEKRDRENKEKWDMEVAPWNINR